jgi:hypothetical protein
MRRLSPNRKTGVANRSEKAEAAAMTRIFKSGSIEILGQVGKEYLVFGVTVAAIPSPAVARHGL